MTHAKEEAFTAPFRSKAASVYLLRRSLLKAPSLDRKHAIMAAVLWEAEPGSAAC